jgi:hypothetical protein
VFDPEGLVPKVAAKPVEADARELARSSPVPPRAKVGKPALEKPHVPGGLHVRVRRGFARVQAVKPSGDRGESLAAGASS